MGTSSWGSTGHCPDAGTASSRGAGIFHVGVIGSSIDRFGGDAYWMAGKELVFGAQVLDEKDAIWVVRRNLRTDEGDNNKYHGGVHYKMIYGSTSILTDTQKRQRNTYLGTIYPCTLWYTVPITRGQHLLSYSWIKPVPSTCGVLRYFSRRRGTYNTIIRYGIPVSGTLHRNITPPTRCHSVSNEHTSFP